jgi:hypothetical protein
MKHHRTCHKSACAADGSVITAAALPEDRKADSCACAQQLALKLRPKEQGLWLAAAVCSAPLAH